MTASPAVLRSLRDRVLAGQGDDPAIDDEIIKLFGIHQPLDEPSMGWFTISLDALAELQRRVLPGWARNTFQLQDGWMIVLEKQDDEASGEHPDECRAWLAAQLSALIAEAEATVKPNQGVR